MEMWQSGIILEVKKNILVFPCGSEIGLEIYRSLCFSNEFELFGASSIDDHGSFLYYNYIPGLPFVDNEDFIYSINKVVEEFNIDFIFPAHDSAILKLVQNNRKVNAVILTSSPDTCEICRSKKKTYNKLKNVINTPELYEIKDGFELPVFLKPDVGQGSKGTLKANSIEEIEHAFENDSNLLISEFLPGNEYTIDCFTDKQGELLFFQARDRARTAGGISVNSRPVFDSEFKKIAILINEALKLRGAWFFQLKKNKNNQLSLLEVAPRIAGTMGLCRIQGVNLPLLTLYDRIGKDFFVPSTLPFVEIDRSLGASYRTNIVFDDVYVDFEDTLIVNGKINSKLMAFLYESLNNKKNIYLFAKSLNLVKEQLRHHKIDRDIFDGIFDYDNIICQNEVLNKKSIIISDSYSNLLALNKILSFPFFKTDTIECLL
jgi:predicted ATP-grasp superfamily ATP-dependent carboligase